MATIQILIPLNVNVTQTILSAEYFYP